MNERIRELAFQAMSINQKVSDDAFFVDVSKLKEFEKFAELIVRECVSVGRTAFLNDNSKLPVFPTKQIREHFGVEE
jgi:hypothetical protein